MLLALFVVPVVYTLRAIAACPWNVRFSRELPNDSPYRPREVLAGRDARSLARELLGMSQDEFSRAFSGSPMKRAKLRGL
jgi:epoxyqueuosine reductase